MDRRISTAKFTIPEAEIARHFGWAQMACFGCSVEKLYIKDHFRTFGHSILPHSSGRTETDRRLPTSLVTLVNQVLLMPRMHQEHVEMLIRGQILVEISGCSVVLDTETVHKLALVC